MADNEGNKGGTKMAKITVFECDICKTQSKKIFTFNFEIATNLLSNGDNKPIVGTPSISHYDVCSNKCAIKALCTMLEVDRSEGDEASSERAVNDLQLTLDIMPS
jgi:hypothetical protein